MFIVGGFAVWVYMEQKDGFSNAGTNISLTRQDVSILEGRDKRILKTISSMQKQIKQLREQLNTLKQQTHTRYVKQQKNNKAQQTTLASHTNRLDQLKQTTISHNGKLVSLANWKQTIQSQTLPTLRKDINSYGARFAVLKRAHSKQLALIKANEDKRFAAQGRQNATFRVQLSSVSNALKQADTRLTTGVKQLVAYTQKADKRFKTIAATTLEHNAKIKRTAATLKPLPKAVLALQTLQKAHKQRIKQLKLQSDARSWMFTRIVSEIKPVQKGIKTLNARLKSSNDRIAKLETKTKNHDLTVANVSSTLPSAMRLLNTLGSQMSENQRKIRALRAKVKKLQN
jgi:chromosome segregation ATPase